LDAFALDVLEARGLCVGLLLGLLEGGRLGLEVGLIWLSLLDSVIVLEQKRNRV